MSGHREERDGKLSEGRHDMLSYSRVSVAPADEGHASTLVSIRPIRRWWRALGTAQARVTLFVIAQPVTTVLWSWALKREMPSIQEAFSTHCAVVNVFLFMAILSTLTLALFPLGVIDLVAGFLFGLGLGLPVALTTKTLGAVFCFLLSRYTCRDCIRRTLVEKYDWLGALSLMMKEQPFRVHRDTESLIFMVALVSTRLSHGVILIVVASLFTIGSGDRWKKIVSTATMALLRLSALPSALKSYGCGGLVVSLRVYTIMTAVTVSMESLFLVPTGAKFDSLRAMFTRKQSMQDKVGFVVGALLLVALLLAIRRTVRRQIEQIRLEKGGQFEQVEANALARQVEEVAPALRDEELAGSVVAGRW